MVQQCGTLHGRNDAIRLPSQQLAQGVAGVEQLVHDHIANPVANPVGPQVAARGTAQGVDEFRVSVVEMVQQKGRYHSEAGLAVVDPLPIGGEKIWVQLS
jgi:hypothetical protein